MKLFNRSHTSCSYYCSIVTASPVCIVRFWDITVFAHKERRIRLYRNSFKCFFISNKTAETVTCAWCLMTLISYNSGIWCISCDIGLRQVPVAEMIFKAHWRSLARQESIAWAIAMSSYILVNLCSVYIMENMHVKLVLVENREFFIFQQCLTCSLKVT